MADDIMNNPGPVVKWIAAGCMVMFVSIAWSEVEDSKYKAEAMAAATESWSKVVVACIESGRENCDEKYRMVVR